MYCACYCKDTHFEAIHNLYVTTETHLLIVLATAKIHILKQFTTYVRSGILQLWLCLLLQRYTFWSNSQLTCVTGPWRNYCACYCKDTHFEAIHNQEYEKNKEDVIVLATAKIHILKQFTTTERATSIRPGLCLLLQRYTFWSNSQLQAACLLPVPHCACYCKDTHFEAIHNVFHLLVG